MPGSESAARGRALLARRKDQAAAAVALVPRTFAALQGNFLPLPRTIVATGIGTSEGHARHLAEVAVRYLGQPARFASTGSLIRRPPPGAEQDWLVVFSQGLSANARYALQHVEAWGSVLLVTGLRAQHTASIAGPSGPSGSAQDEEAEPCPPEKRAWLEDLTARGVVCIDMGCGCEYGALLRVVGARVGYAVAWSLLRSLAQRQLVNADALDFDAQALLAAQEAAGEHARRLFAPVTGVGRASESPARAQPLAPSTGAGAARDGQEAPWREAAAFFASDRTLLLVAEGGTLDLAEQLSLKLSEGLLRPQPRCVDVLQFAHGPLQSLAGKPASILFLAPAEEDPALEAAAEGWLERLRAALDPETHALRVVRSSLPLPFAVLEFEALLDECVLGVLEQTSVDIVDWPGREREAALYGAGPARLDSVAHSTDSPPGRSSQARAGERGSVPPILADGVWPQVEQWHEAGRRTALIALGSIEQHGPHLPLGTDHWIAEALAQGLAARLPDAVALPAVALGCASEHLDFAGTLHIAPATLEALLVDQLASLRRHGFERAFVFTAHGGNLDALEGMRTRVVASGAPLDVRIETDLRVGLMQAQAVEAEALPGRTAGPHAGEYETSLVAWLRPGSVRSGALAPGRVVERGEGQGLFYPSLRPNAQSGVLGDPSSASAERGMRYLDAWLDLLETAYWEAFPAAPGARRSRAGGMRSGRGASEKKRQ